MQIFLSLMLLGLLQSSPLVGNSRATGNMVGPNGTPVGYDVTVISQARQQGAEWVFSVEATNRSAVTLTLLLSTPKKGCANEHLLRSLPDPVDVRCYIALKLEPGKSAQSVITATKASMPVKSNRSYDLFLNSDSLGGSALPLYWPDDQLD